MTDHANELRRHARKIGHPAGDVPAVMAAAADWIEHLRAKSEAAEKERDNANAAAVSIALQVGALQAECDELCTKIAAMEKQESITYQCKVPDGWPTEEMTTEQDTENTSSTDEATTDVNQANQE